MKSSFSGYQMSSLVRLVSPKFNVRVNKAGNLAIEPSPVVNAECTRKWVFYKTPEGFVIRTGTTTDTRQRSYSRLGYRTNEVDAWGCHVIQYTFPTFKDALKHFKGTLRKGKYLD